MNHEIYRKPECRNVIRNRFAPSANHLYWGTAVGLVAVILEMRERLGKEAGTLIELGSAAGESGSLFAGSGLFEKVFLVDAWPWPGVEQVCEFNIRRYDNAEMVKGDMFEIAECWTEQADAIYLDAAHDYDSVIRGLETWDRHLRPGGIWAGHDYNAEVWPGVIKAVAEFFPDQQVKVFEDLSWMVTKADPGEWPAPGESHPIDEHYNPGDGPEFYVEK